MAKLAIKKSKPGHEPQDERRPNFASAPSAERPPRTRRFSLRMLREALGMTQAEVAAKAGMTQSDLSKLEARDDVKLSTLNRYLEALGSSVEVSAVFKNGRRFMLDIGGNANKSG